GQSRVKLQHGGMALYQQSPVILCRFEERGSLWEASGLAGQVSEIEQSPGQVIAILTDVGMDMDQPLLQFLSLGEGVRGLGLLAATVQVGQSEVSVTDGKIASVVEVLRFGARQLLPRIERVAIFLNRRVKAPGFEMDVTQAELSASQFGKEERIRGMCRAQRFPEGVSIPVCLLGSGEVFCFPVETAEMMMRLSQLALVLFSQVLESLLSPQEQV